MKRLKNGLGVFVRVLWKTRKGNTVVAPLGTGGVYAGTTNRLGQEFQPAMFIPRRRSIYFAILATRNCLARIG